MIDNSGVYICGDTKFPDATIVLVSTNGKLYTTKIDDELNPEGFMGTMTVKGPFKGGSDAKENADA